MEASLHAMRVAARVLLAYGEKREPDPADVEELRRLDPLLSDLAINELACDVIGQALKRRAELRARGLGDLSATTGGLRVQQLSSSRALSCEP